MQTLSWQGSLSLLVGTTRARIKQLYMRRLSEHGITPQQMGTLLCLREQGGASLRRLSSQVRTDEPTASRIVARLIDRGLVRTAQDPTDRRRTRLSLSPQGRALSLKLLPIREQVEAQLARGISPEELEALRRTLAKVLSNAMAVEAPQRVKRRASLAAVGGAVPAHRPVRSRS